VEPIPFYDTIIKFDYMNIADKGSKVTVYFLLSDFLLIIMFARIYFVIRAVFNFSRFTDVYAKKLCKSYGFTANVRFTFKSMLITDPGLTCLTSLASSVFVLAYMMRVFEAPYYDSIGQMDFNRYFTAIWCIIITMTTVGYGDEFPGTDFGKVIAIVASLWGTFLISILILVAGQVFALNSNEQKALCHLLQTRKAAELITSSMKYFHTK
jgi:hypothetical protein